MFVFVNGSLFKRTLRVGMGNENDPLVLDNEELQRGTIRVRHLPNGLKRNGVCHEIPAENLKS